MVDQLVDQQRLQVRYRKAQKQNAELLAELEVTRRMIARLRSERKYKNVQFTFVVGFIPFVKSLILDQIYKEEVATLEVVSSDEEGLDDKLIDWAELEASFARRGLSMRSVHHSAATTGGPTNFSSSINLGSKRRASVNNVHASSPKKSAPMKPSSTAGIIPPTNNNNNNTSASVQKDVGASTTTTATNLSVTLTTPTLDESISSLGSAAKPKRIIKTAEAAAAVPRKAHSVPMDSDGRPILPITCGIVTVHELGTIVTDRSTFHNKRYIWPVGYRSSRQYLSATDRESQTTYFSTILDGPNGPIFDVYAEDNPTEHYQSATSTGVWSTIVKLANMIRGKEYSNSASGPDFFGFSNATIAMMIETLPGVEGCINYQRKNFELAPVTSRSKSSIAHLLSAPPSSSLGGTAAEEEHRPDEDVLDIGQDDERMPSTSSGKQPADDGLMALASQALGDFPTPENQ